MKIAPEALPLAACLGVLLVAAGWLHPALALGGSPLLLFTLWFFRDPHRRVPAAPDALISPADGKIIQAGPRRVSIFMNVFDVHVCRAPMAGRVESLEHHRGRFLAAFKDEASTQNERLVVTLSQGSRTIRFTLVAGLVARRIVCRLAVGESVQAGQRIGLIRFGSRVDVDLPQDAEVRARLGQRVVAGETLLVTLAPMKPGTQRESYSGVAAPGAD